MGSVIILVENDFEDMEALYPYYRMQEAGHKAIVVGDKKEVYKSKHGYPLKADRTPAEIELRDFSAVIIPGGQAPDRMRIRPAMVGLVREAAQKGLVIGAICHGAQVLIEAGVVKGKKATCYVSVKTDLMNAGAMYLDAPVVKDGMLVTSRHPGDLPEFCKTLLELIG